MSMICWVQTLLYSCLSRVLNVSCVWMLVSCFRFDKFEATISIKIFFVLFNFISVFFYLDSQVWSFGCISDFLEVLVVFNIFSFYVCLSVLFYQLCSSSNSFFLYGLVCWECFLK